MVVLTVNGSVRDNQHMFIPPTISVSMEQSPAPVLGNNTFFTVSSVLATLDTWCKYNCAVLSPLRLNNIPLNKHTTFRPRDIWATSRPWLTRVSKKPPDPAIGSGEMPSSGMAGSQAGLL